MTKQIVLVRHGRSSHRHRGWIDHEGFTRWRDAYEAAGVAEEDKPPEPLCAVARSASIVLSSDAKRAVESARAIAPARASAVSPLFRELDLEAFRIRFPVPLPVWALSVGARMLLRRITGAPRHDTREDERLAAAVRHLEDLAADHDTIVVVTHAMVREEIARRLGTRGWAVATRESARKHWSAWMLELRRDG